MISQSEEKLNGRGRILVRASGTEPLIRVMAEGDNLIEVETAVNDICNSIEKVS